MVLASLASSPAQAAWHVAKSRHFIIYADQNPRELSDFATKLEKFDSAVRFVRTMRDYPVGDGNRLQVFVVSSDDAVRRLARRQGKFIRGFYVPRASGSLAFVPQETGSSSPSGINEDIIFFHEYAHHLMMQDLHQPVPEWLVEGFAEFMSTARFDKDGSVTLGLPASHRAHGLYRNEPLPLEQLLTGSYGKIGQVQRESIYGRGWLLAHYLTFEPTRKGQLDSYLRGIAAGVAPMQAATSAFGDLKVLEKALDRYLRRNKFTYLKVAPSALKLAPIEVTPLTPGAAAVLPLRMESKRGVNSVTAEPLAVRVRDVARRFPGDPLVEVTLAEAEIDARKHDAAEAAADRALKADPRNIEAMIYKGRAILERAARASGDRAVQFAEARKWFSRANRIDPDDPEPLMFFHQSYVRSGSPPTQNAIEALHFASNLAPQDLGLRMNSARQYIRDGKYKEARRTLAPIAYNPHGGQIAEIARNMIARVDADDPKGAASIADNAPAEADGDEGNQP